MKMKQVAGLDIGNGYVKVLCNTAPYDKPMTDKEAEGFDLLSGVAYVTNPNDIKVREEEAWDIMADIFNNLDASIDSPVVRDNTRRLYGKRAIASGYSLEEFDVFSSLSKAKQDLSGLLALGSLAGHAVKKYYELNHKLPDELLQVETRLALALPISEYKIYRKLYRDSFMNHTHFVSIHNFEKPVRVEIKVLDVQVLAEGASGQYGINAKGEPLMDAMLSDVRKLDEGFIAPGITAEDVLRAKGTVCIDIGEGTVNFPVFQSGKFNTDVSKTLKKGYGNVLSAALDRLWQEGFQYNSRKALADFLLTEPSRINERRYMRAKRVTEEETLAFCREINQEFRKVLAQAGSFIEVVYVYGGGATPVKDILYPMLIDTAKLFSGNMEDGGYPILYLDSRYSRFLNREGLYVIASQLAKKEGFDIS